MRTFGPLVAAALIAWPLADGGAQVRASERSGLTQTVNGTVITVDYSRPRVRGRSPVFGKVVEWGEVWTPGANWATTFDFTRDVRIDGHPVPKGKYSVWFVVRRSEWTIVLDPRFQLYHEERPDSTEKQIRWTVHPAPGPFTEALTWSVPTIRPDGGILQFAWATSRLTLPFTVPLRYPLTISRADAEPYLGHYRWSWVDSTDTSAERMELYYEKGMLKQRYAPFPTWWRSLQNQPMVRINDDWFIPSIVRRGQVEEMAADFVLEFTVKDGKAVSFEVRDDRDNLLGTGRRVDP
jgi:hypothetical protein